MTDRTPRASRPLRNLYLAVADIVRDDAYINMTGKEFVAYVMEKTGGSVPPDEVMNIYYRLMNDAGLELLKDD